MQFKYSSQTTTFPTEMVRSPWVLEPKSAEET